jgi:hypothetical protein
MNSDIVKPMPPTMPTTAMPAPDTSRGHAAIRSAMPIRHIATMPSGLPIARPSTMPTKTWLAPPASEAPPSSTPALASANSGMMANATHR